MPKAFRDVRNALGPDGWTHVGQAGLTSDSAQPAGSRVVTLAGKDSDTVCVGILAAIRRATGLKDLR